MKKILILIMTVLLMMLSGCGKSEYEVSKDQVGIIIQPEIEEEYYRMVIQYSLSDVALGKRIIESADGTAIKEESLFFTIDRDSFPEGILNLRNFSIAAVVYLDKKAVESDILTDENMLVSYECEPFEARFGKIHVFTLRENADGTLELIKE